jgi:hypothetical protein
MLYVDFKHCVTTQQVPHTETPVMLFAADMLFVEQIQAPCTQVVPFIMLPVIQLVAHMLQEEFTQGV